MKLVRHTVSFCNTCYREIPARVVASSGAVMMHKECSVHGKMAAEVERDPVFYTYVIGLKSPHIYSGYFVDVTKRCNLRCHYCYYHLEKQDPEGEFSIARLVEDCQVNRQHTPFIITGGEPTTRDDIVEVIDAIQEVGPAVMLSNGVNLSRDEDLLHKVMARLTRDGVFHLNLSIHDDQTDEWRGVLDCCRLLGRKVESVLIVVDSKERFKEALDLCRELKDVAVSFRIKAASRLWNEQKPQKKIFVSDMLRWLEETGAPYQFVAHGHNKPSFVNVSYEGMWLMLVSWYQIENVDLIDIACPPYYRAKNGEVCNLVRWGLINEGMQKGFLYGQRVAPIGGTV